MKTIAYMGAAYSGRTTNLLHLHGASGGQLTQRAPTSGAEGIIVTLETTSPHGLVRLRSVPGLVFADDARREAVADADCVVFVADSRRDRLDATLESWETLRETVKLPVVVQYNRRDVPDAVAIEEIEEMLGLEPFIVSGNLRMPNPISMMFPLRFPASAVRGEGVRETLEAASHAAHFGIPKPDATFAMAMLDRQIASGLASALPGRSDAGELAKAALRGEDGREAYLGAMKESQMEDLLRRLDDDPEFADFIAERVRKSAEASVIAEIECAFCKEREPCLEIGFQRPDAVGPFRIGEALPVDLARVDPSAYTLLRSPEGHQLLVLECNQCPKCRELTWYGLVIEGSKLASIWPVALTRSTLGRSHLASAALALEAGRLVGRSPEEMTPTGTLEILSQRLPP